MTFTRRQFTRLCAAAGLLPLAAGPVRAGSHQVNIKSMEFIPADLAIAVGDTVTFLSEDSPPHTASAKDESFDTGKLTKGQSATITFAQAGEFDYFCKFHPSMKARITVA
ncbi:cupredoxin domain-containing protein [Tabrizicola oligotrophica]|uniref:Cupredoxin family copper-binding protein n=1 Tax=Tabrizicola oligotrophica TaxID=2710650 RepID=A0A6M0QNF0_9RHOB|nr:cupredoxin family copper-binding protein [Tabrizicola oligotrophica]NEY88945.1 cupredoxin family copper-binding protein [Tabrizicola oligotrophica]